LVRENFGAIESFEKTPGGVRMNFSRNHARVSEGGRSDRRHFFFLGHQDAWAARPRFILVRTI
jgi:hypothetical protein